MGDADDRGGVPLLDAIERLADDAATLSALVADDAVWRSQDRDVLAAVGRLARVRAELEAAHLRLVGQVDTRGVAEASPVATSPEGFLRTACLMGAAQARRDVAAARATATGAALEPFAQLLRDGRCTRHHVDLGVRVLDRIPRSTLAQDGAGRRIADYLLLAAADAAPVDLERASRDLLRSLVEDPDERFDPEAVQRRFVDLSTDATGMVVGRLQLDPAAGAALRAALQRWSGPETGADGEADARQPRQRRADALAHLVQTAMAVEHPRRGERPRVVVHCTPEQLAGLGRRDDGGPVGMAWTEDGEPLPTWAARRLACDAVLQRVVQAPSEGPLDVGRTQRLATITQRRALAARDGGCVVHGCGASPDICDAHHVRHWADGGATDMGNLVLLCPGHHTAVHAGTWSVSIDAHQQVSVTPPRWVDPLQEPRPAWRQRAAEFRRGSWPAGGSSATSEGSAPEASTTKGSTKRSTEGSTEGPTEGSTTAGRPPPPEEPAAPDVPVGCDAPPGGTEDDFWTWAMPQLLDADIRSMPSSTGISPEG